MRVWSLRARRAAHFERRTCQDVGGGVAFVLVRSGTARAGQNSRQVDVRPGEFVVLDCDRAFTFDTDGSFEHLVLLVPRRMLPLSTRALDAASAVRFSSRRGLGALLPATVSALWRVGGGVTDHEVDFLMRSLGELLAQLVASGQAAADPVDRHLARAKEHIHARIGDRDLRPASVAAACGVSTSYLHKVFRASGTSVAGYIREARLQGCLRELRSAGAAGSTITEIGARWGLADPAHLCRLFQTRFGMSPGRVRFSGIRARPTAG